MSRNPKQSQGRELEDEDETGAPRIQEQEVDDEERALQSLSKTDKHAEYEIEDEDIIEDIDVDDLDAMEGPDA